MTVAPVTLADSAVLHTDDRYLVWRSAVVAGPTGVAVVNVEVALVDGTSIRTNPDWVLDGRPPPIDAYIEMVGEPRLLSGSFSNIRDRWGFHYTMWCPPVDPALLHGARLHIKIHPVRLHSVVELAAV